MITHSSPNTERTSTNQQIKEQPPNRKMGIGDCSQERKI